MIEGLDLPLNLKNLPNHKVEPLKFFKNNYSNYENGTLPITIKMREEISDIKNKIIAAL